MVVFPKIRHRVVEVNFLEIEEGKVRKIAHGVKKIKGAYIKDVCENGGLSFDPHKGSIDIFV